MKLMVYNFEFDFCREVIVIFNVVWGGEGRYFLGSRVVGWGFSGVLGGFG